jgi:hypothetical protein
MTYIRVRADCEMMMRVMDGLKFLAFLVFFFLDMTMLLLFFLFFIWMAFKELMELSYKKVRRQEQMMKWLIKKGRGLEKRPKSRLTYKFWVKISYKNKTMS